jgi:hypothetical protein
MLSQFEGSNEICQAHKLCDCLGERESPSCYDMEVGENRVRVFYGTEKREKEKSLRYIQKASAPAAEPCIRPVISCISVTQAQEQVEV